MPMMRRSCADPEEIQKGMARKSPDKLEAYAKDEGFGLCGKEAATPG